MGTLIILLLVTARIAATTWANLVQKRLLAPASYSPLQLFTLVWGWMTLLTIPWWLPTLTVGSHFWVWMLLTCALEVPGNVLLLRSLRSTELSIFGPLSSVKPAISLLLAMLLFREVPSALGLVGVAVILCGSWLLTSQPLGTVESQLDRRTRRAGIGDRLLAVVLTAAASVLLKQTLDLATPWQVLAAWCVLSWLLAVVWSAIERAISHGRPGLAQVPQSQVARTPPVQTEPRKGQLQPRLRERFRIHQQHRRAVFMVAFGMLIMQGCTIALFSRMPVGYALALFQIGSLVSVFVGHRLLGEEDLWRKLLASAIMVFGALVIILGA